MKKNLPLIVLMVFLMVMNTLLLYLVLEKPNRGERKRHPKTFIADELGFDDEQMAEFFDLDESHRQRMRTIDRRTGELRKTLFSFLEKNDSQNSKIDSLANLIATLSKERELEIFGHFNAIEKICNENQKRKLKRIVEGALRPGPPGGPPPPHSSNHPPR